MFQYLFLIINNVHTNSIVSLNTLFYNSSPFYSTQLWYILSILAPVVATYSDLWFLGPEPGLSAGSTVSTPPAVSW